MHPDQLRRLQALLRKLAHKAVANVISYALEHGIDPDQEVKAKVVDEDAGLQFVAILTPWAGPARLLLNEIGRAILKLPPAPAEGDAAPSAGTPPAGPLYYRPLTEAEALVMSALPRREPRTAAQVAAAAGYSPRYARDVLSGLFRDGMVFKGAGDTWLRL